MSDPSGLDDAWPAAYPERWEADVVVGDGATVHIRPIIPDDGDRLVRFHGRQSPESIYFRFFSPHPRLSEREVAHLTTVDFRDRMAFVALLSDEIIAVGRYEPWEQGVAETAFFVDDEHHGRGLATVLLEYLVVAAREAGYRALTATVLPSNLAMLKVFRRAGFAVTSEFAEGVVEVRLGIEPSPRPRRRSPPVPARPKPARWRGCCGRAPWRLSAPAAEPTTWATRWSTGCSPDISPDRSTPSTTKPTWSARSGRTAPCSTSLIPVDLAVLAVPADQLAV